MLPTQLSTIGPCPHGKSIGMQTMVQYGRSTLDDPCHYDGWSELRCTRCGLRRGRWSGAVFRKEDAHEPPRGGAHAFGCTQHRPTLTLMQGGTS